MFNSYTGWWYTYPSEKWWSSPFGIIPYIYIYGKVMKFHVSKPPTWWYSQNIAVVQVEPPMAPNWPFRSQLQVSRSPHQYKNHRVLSVSWSQKCHPWDLQTQRGAALDPCHEAWLQIPIPQFLIVAMPQLGQDYPGFSGVVQGVSHCFPFSIRDSNGLRQNLQETNENNDFPMNYGVTSIKKKNIPLVISHLLLRLNWISLATPSFASYKLGCTVIYMQIIHIHPYLQFEAC